MRGRWELIGAPECPVVFRWTLLSTRFGKLFLHRFVPGAGREDTHDHPADFVTVVLRGGYDDVALCPGCEGSGRWPLRSIMVCRDCLGSGRVVDVVRAPTVRRRRAEHAHVTAVHPDGALTLVAMGPKRRAWGFFREGRWWAFLEYDRRFGSSFRCDDGVVVVDEP